MPIDTENRLRAAMLGDMLPIADAQVDEFDEAMIAELFADLVVPGPPPGPPVIEVDDPPVRVGVMAGQQVIHRTARGLRTWPNRLAALEGSLLLAQNAVLDRDGIISCRRGFSRYTATAARQLFEYLFRAVVLEGQTLKMDDGTGILTAWPGLYDPPAGVRMRGQEIDQKFIFTTSKGPYIQESASGTPRRSGMPRGLDVQLSLVGSGGSWLLPDTQVGYRVTWGKDELAPGAPSFLAVIPNPKRAVTLSRVGTLITVVDAGHGAVTGDILEVSDLEDAEFIIGPHVVTVLDSNRYTYSVAVAPTEATTTGKVGKKYQVRLTSTIPQEVAVDWWYEVYRTTMSPSIDAQPFNDGRRVVRTKVTSADIANGFITFTDPFDEVDRASGVELYTNEGTQEGETQANDRPPFALFISTFRGHTWYLNIRFAHQLKVQLFSTEGITDDVDTFTVNVGGAARVYTFSTADDLGLRKFRRFTAAGEGSKALAVRKTAQSLAKVINRDAGSVVYSYYGSGAFDPPGTLIFERRDLVDSPFHLTATAVAGAVFTPQVPLSGVAVISDAQKQPHRGARSKFQKPEAVPALNTSEFGRLGFAIQGAAATKESMIVPTQAGIWELTGETDRGAGRSFNERELDPDLLLLHPETFVSIDNVAIGWFESGFLRVSSGGSAKISTPIEDLIIPLISLANFRSAVFARPYKSQEQYLLFVPAIGSEDKSERVWVYSTSDNEWSGPWLKPVRDAIVLEGGDDRLYLAHADDGYLLQERKNFTDNDFIDEDLAVTVNSVPATVIVNGREVTKVTVSFPYPSYDLTEGWLLTQAPHRAVVESVSDAGGGAFTLRLDRLIPVALGPALLSLPIDVRVEWMDQAAGNVGVKKQFDRLFVYHETSRAHHHYLGVIANTVGTESWSPRIDHPRRSGWGSNWGKKWGDPLPSHAIPVIAEIPTEHRKAETMRPMYRHKWALEPVNICQLSIDYTSTAAKGG